MTLGILFEYVGEPVEVRIQESNIYFRTPNSMGWATIDNIQLDHAGAIREFPDLAGNKDWKRETIKRFKAKMKELKTEKARADYIIEDLKKYGYVPRYLQRQGFRVQKIT